MNTETVLANRKERIVQILKEKDLAGALVIDGIRENYDSWLMGSEEIPTLEPFGRLNLFLVDQEGQTRPLCAYQNHPCDFPHYELFQARMLEGSIRNHRIGIVNPECLLAVTKEEICAFDPEIQFEDLTDAFLRAKAEKCEEETAAVRENAAFMDRIFKGMPWYLREGQSEYQIAVDLRREIGTLGIKNSKLFEDPMAATSIELTSSQKDAPSDTSVQTWPGRILQPDDRINLCINTYLYGGFCAALGRCYILGTPTEENAICWELAVKAQDFLAEKLQPGRTISEAVEELNREIIEPNGFAPVSGRCVYGIGCSRWEAPKGIDRTAQMKIKSGMTLVLAPQITIPGKDPYCCMDVYQVLEGGAVRMSRTSRDLIVTE